MQVTLYTKPDCIFCVKTKDLLKFANLEYTELVKDVHFDGNAYKERLWPSYPCVVIDGNIVGGYKEFSAWVTANILYLG